jgi:hypothetical protein
LRRKILRFFKQYFNVLFMLETIIMALCYSFDISKPFKVYHEKIIICETRTIHLK